MSTVSVFGIKPFASFRSAADSPAVCFILCSPTNSDTGGAAEWKAGKKLPEVRGRTAFRIPVRLIQFHFSFV